MGVHAENTCCIYAIRCDVNGKMFIGWSCEPERRAAQLAVSLRSDRKYAPGRSELAEDFRKYGLGHFHLHILEDDVRPGHRESRKRYWIKEYKSDDPEYGYNTPERNGKPAINRVEGLPPKPGQRCGA